jgi:DNA-binding CsgD family transcriptional regulator
MCGHADEKDSILDALDVKRVDWAAYLTWLRNPAWSDDQVAEHLQRPAAEVARCRTSLLDKGLLVSAGAELLPVGTADVIDGLLAEVDAAAAHRRAQIIQARSALAATMTAGLARHAETPYAEIEWVEGPSSIAVVLDEFTRTAGREILVLHGRRSPCCADAQACRLVRPGTDGSDIAVRIIYEHGHAALGELNQLSTADARVRTVGRVDRTIVVFDRQISLLTSDDRTMLRIHRPEVVAALASLFDQCWSVAQSLPDTSPVPDADEPVLDERGRALLKQLALGMKDDAIARNLGVSVRSVRRYVSELCKALDVTSRFQAGVQAARRGWL